VSGPPALTLGVVADSHGFLCDATRRELAGCDLILHAGDIGGSDVLAELGAIAPVLAVAGNGDPELAHALPLEQRVELAGVRILLCHWYDNFGRIHPKIARELEAYCPHALVYGHTHAAVNARHGECLYFNPGYAGPPGRGRRRSLGRLRLAAGGVAGEIVELPANGVS
jgi:putative phosphoesterase